MTESEKALCPCQSNLSYTRCCQPLHLQQAFAKTAKALMRSRYSAFVKQQVDYLLATHHPDYRDLDESVQLTAQMARTAWLGLQIIETRHGRKKDSQGTVEFIASYSSSSQPGVVNKLHERSRFAKVNGRWYYTDGDLI